MNLKEKVGGLNGLYTKKYDILIKQYPNDKEKYPDKDIVTNDRIAVKLKTIRTAFKKAVDSGKRIGGGRVVLTF